MVGAHEFLFILTYATVLAVFAYLIIRYALGRERHHGEVGGRGRVSTLSRVRFLTKVSITIMRNALTLLIATSIVLTALAAAYSATSRVGYVSLRAPAEERSAGHSVLLLKFKQLIPASNASLILNSLLRAVAPAGTHATIGWAAYHMLGSPIKVALMGRVEDIYVLIGLPEEALARTFPKAAASGAELIYGAGVAPKVTVVTLKLPNATVVRVKILVVPASEVRNSRLADGIPLLPIQSYLGSKPVEVPPKYALIGGLRYVNSLIGEGGDLINTAYATLAGNVSVKRVIRAWGAIRDYVSALTIIEGGRVVIVSGTEVPTLKSLATAAVSTAIACILCLSITASLVPKLRNLYRKLSLIGMPSWSVGVVNSMYTSLSVLAPGLAVTIASYALLGGVPALNSLLTTLITWAAFTAYVCRKSGVRRGVSDVYVQPTPRYVISVATTDLRGVLREVKASIEGNEFFDIEELEERMFGSSEAALHARLTYRETWGVGLDVEVLASVVEGYTHVSIYSNVWGIEEVSGTLMKDVLALALSRIVGRLRVWESLPTY